jgi:indolepyruvate ferredoxin oxidoreductase
MQHIETLMPLLNHENHAHALNVANVPENIKGFGHVKERNLKAARTLWASLKSH